MQARWCDPGQGGVVSVGPVWHACIAIHPVNIGRYFGNIFRQCEINSGKFTKIFWKSTGKLYQNFMKNSANFRKVLRTLCGMLGKFLVITLFVKFSSKIMQLRNSWTKFWEISGKYWGNFLKYLRKFCERLAKIIYEDTWRNSWKTCLKKMLEKFHLPVLNSSVIKVGIQKYCE